jgi:hypothetical protein
MARNHGTFNFAANFEVLTKAPLDARLVVDTKAALISPSTWQDTALNVWLYKGIVVSVTSDPSTNNNGLYYLTDETQYTNYSYWLKINTIGTTDASGTSSATFQLNNGDNGVVLKDSSGNLEIVKFDGSTYANLRAGYININSLKIDSLNGALYAQDGSVYAVPGSFGLKAFEGTLFGNGITKDFTIDHSLNTIRQSISIWDGSSAIYPDLLRGSNTDTIRFSQAPLAGTNYDIIILGF